MKRIFMMLVAMLAIATQVLAQKTCVIASAEDHVPIREALIHTNNNHWARTDYRGYWTMRYQFDSATVSKPGYVKTTIRYQELPDTVFMLPESQKIGEVTVWGKNQEHVEEMEKQIQKKVDEIPKPVVSVNFNAFGWMDKQGNRDRKHKQQAKEIFKKMDRKDPIVSAYEQATGKKYGLQDPFSVSGKKEEENADAPKDTDASKDADAPKKADAPDEKK